MGVRGSKPPEAESLLKTVNKSMLEFFNVKQLIRPVTKKTQGHTSMLRASIPG